MLKRTGALLKIIYLDSGLVLRRPQSPYHIHVEGILQSFCHMQYRSDSGTCRCTAVRSIQRRTQKELRY